MALRAVVSLGCRDVCSTAAISYPRELPHDSSLQIQSLALALVIIFSKNL